MPHEVGRLDRIDGAEDSRAASGSQNAVFDDAYISMLHGIKSQGSRDSRPNEGALTLESEPAEPLPIIGLSLEELRQRHKPDEQKEQSQVRDLLYREKLGWKNEPSEKEIESAQRKLEDAMSPLVPEGDRKIVNEISNALLQGDAKAMQQALSSLADNPERLRKFVEEINHNLREVNAGVSLAVNRDGQVLAYKNHGHTAVQFDLKTGETTLRPIQANFDGTVRLLPGEILNGDAEKSLKNIGNAAVNNINGPTLRFDPLPIKPLPYPVEPKPWGGHPGIVPLPWINREPRPWGMDPGFYKESPAWNLDPGFYKEAPAVNLDPGFYKK